VRSRIQPAVASSPRDNILTMNLLRAYNAFLYIVLVCAGPYLIVRSLFDRGFRRVLRRFGPYPRTIPSGGLWVHAVSVGEVAVAKPLVFDLRKKFPALPLVVSTSTTTGQDAAMRAFAGHDVSVTFFPFDISFAVKRALSAIRPRALMLLETELWPNVIRQTAARGIPVILLNGRLSASSVKWYRFIAPLITYTLGAFDALGMRSEEDAQRIRDVGADPSVVCVVGNVKFEASLLSVNDERKAGMARDIGLRETERLIVAGSTHPGEEELILDVFVRLREQVPASVLLLAPRHVTRLNQVCDAVKRAGLEFVLRTNAYGDGGRRQVIVLNTTGELATLYALGEIAIVGKSFLQNRGGHNPLEPAAAGIPVFFGPHMENFAGPVELLHRHGGCIQVNTADELYARCLELLVDEHKREQVGRSAKEVVISGGGALGRSVDLVDKVLRARGSLCSAG
jgi:3-deoxy-D-manno-octulosonic-acid transferase